MSRVLRPSIGCLSVLVGLVMGFTDLAGAGAYWPYSFLNLGLSPADYSGCAGLATFENGTCSEAGSPGLPAGSPAFVWVLLTVTDVGFPDGLAGIQFGIEHDALDPVSWTLCTGGSEIPEDGWPASGTSHAATWEGGCYRPDGEVAVVGFLTAVDWAATASAALTIDRRIGRAVWADCDIEIQYLCEGYGEVFTEGCLVEGFTPYCPTLCGDEWPRAGEPCSATPIAETSWGRIKAGYTTR